MSEAEKPALDDAKSCFERALSSLKEADQAWGAVAELLEQRDHERSQS